MPGSPAMASLRAVLTVAFLLIIGSHAMVPPPRLKNVNVALQTRWEGTSLLLEAAELLGKLNDDFLWQFVDRWSQQSTVPVSDEACFNKILQIGSSILDGPLQPVFHLSLLLRSASAKLVLYRQLIEESLLHHMTSGQPVIEETYDRTGDSFITSARSKPCCWVDSGDHAFSKASELKQWLDAIETGTKGQEAGNPHRNLQLLESDHVFPGSKLSRPVAILYGAPTTSCFSEFHTLLAKAANLGLVKYVLRPHLSLDCQSHEGGCVSLGTTGKVYLGGYAVELALKNMEYKAIDDSDVKKNEIMDETRTDDLSEEVRGFIFSRLLERRPYLTDELLTFRDHLLSSSFSDMMNVWELKDLGYQTAQRILHASDPLHVMQDINQNFPKVVSAISRLKLNVTIKEEIVANQRLVNPGKNMLAINGALIDLEGLDLYSLIELVLGELSFADIIFKLQVPAKYGKSLMQIPDPAELASVRIDFRSPHVHYLNNLEEDAMYRRWPSNLQELLMPAYPGQMRYIKKNLFHAVYIIDPATPSGLQVIDIILYYYENKVPMRFGIILMSTGVTQRIANNDGELSSLDIKEDLSSLAGKLFLYMKENYGAVAAFQFLSNINEARGGDMDSQNDDPVELTHVEEAFFGSLRSRVKRPEEILLKLEKESDYEDLMWDSISFVYKLGLQNIQPCLLMNGVVHKSTNLQGGLQAMSEELPKLQEGVYFGHINSHTDILEKFLREKTYFRYNPDIVATSKEDARYISLAGAFIRDETLLKSLTFLHSPGTEDDVKPVTHLICIDPASVQGFQLLLQSVKYLNDGSKKGRIGILFNMIDVPEFGKASSPFLLVRVIKAVLRGSGGNKKVLPFFYSLLSWYVSPNNMPDDAGDSLLLKSREFAESVKLKVDLSDSSLLSLESIEKCLKEVARETQFLSRHVGLEPGTNVVIANGKLFIQRTKGHFVAEDFALLEAVEFDRRVKPVNEVIDKVEWDGIDPDDLTSEFLSSVIMCISSEMALRNRGSDTARFDLLQSEYSAIVQDSENATVHVDAIVDPLSSTGQRLSPFFVLLQSWFQASMRILLNPMNSLADLPLKNFYRFVIPNRHPFNLDGSLQAGPYAVFTNMPPTRTLTMNLDVPEPWLLEPVDATYDLDNIVLEKLGDVRTMHAVFELEALMLTGHCYEQNNGPPRGLQLVLGTNLNQHVTDTIVMANLGYWQLKAAPGLWTLRLAPGRSSDLYTFHGPQEGDNDGPLTKQIVIKDLRGEILHLGVVKRKGKENEAILSGTDNGNSEYEDHSGKKGWNQNLLKWATDFLGGGKPQLVNNSGQAPFVERKGEPINIFSIASGHLYERFSKIMMLSVLKNTKRPVKFWFIKNYLSPQFKNFIPYMAKEYGFQYDLVTYKWPTWLHKQTEKQRIIWAYKILFLDVIFPLSLRKVIFVDADQVVRTDMGELYDMDLKGRPLAYTPFCDNNKEMDGYRFWNQGFWKDHLKGRPYHISALYVVDLKKFRQTAAGDTLRVFYETLSKDPGSLSNLDQDLPNYAQHQVPIYSLPQEWLWCESWCGNATKAKAKTIDLCNNPMTKEPKLQGARRIVAEWVTLDEEARALTARVEGDMEPSKLEGLTREEKPDVAVGKAKQADVQTEMGTEQNRDETSNLETASEL